MTGSRRYFIELAYKGAAYSGFQVQDNANSVQAEVEKALRIYFRKYIDSLPASVWGAMPPFTLTGSSRTDAGVNARQNFFHTDSPIPLVTDGKKHVYHLNAILPPDIVLIQFHEVPAEAHCRFDAIAREYRYYLYAGKDPFLADRAFFFPYRLNEALLQEAAGILKEYTDFTSFSKRNTQVHTFNCTIAESRWEREGDCLVYTVRANRFLRGMVRGLVGTMLRVGREKIGVAGFREIIEARDCSRADFSVPGHGLFLERVFFPYLEQERSGVLG